MQPPPPPFPPPPPPPPPPLPPPAAKRNSVKQLRIEGQCQCTRFNRRSSSDRKPQSGVNGGRHKEMDREPQNERNESGHYWLQLVRVHQSCQVLTDSFVQSPTQVHCSSFGWKFSHQCSISSIIAKFELYSITGLNEELPIMNDEKFKEISVLKIYWFYGDFFHFRI